MVGKETKTRTHSIFRFVGWILAAHSLLNLIRDLNLIELYGLLREWTTAYGLLVSNLGYFLLGWITWGQFGIDGSETHVVVIAALMGSAAGRAGFTTDIAHGRAPSYSAHIGMAIGMPIFFGLMVLFWPPPGSLIYCLGMEAFVTLIWAIDRNNAYLSFSEFRKELLIAITGLMMLIILNYSIFRS